MKRKRALIRRLDAVESLGALQVVCFDKTGTLTRNSMMVQGVYAGLQRVSRANGDARVSASRLEVLALLKTAVLCNEAQATSSADGEFRFTGSATESALLSLAAESGIDVDALRARHPVLQKAYRDSLRRRMTTLHHDIETDRYVVAVKGSPDEVLSLCVSYHTGATVEPLTEDLKQKILDLNAQLGTDGLRVLGFAMREFQSEPNGDTETELVWLGLAGLADPIRDEAPDLMRRFHDAGIRTVMITGDQASTAAAVARDLQLVRGRVPKVVTSAEIDTASAADLTRMVRDADVFARVSPSHKLKIVKALQQSGLVVGMTGDGINDGPALRAADIGIAMGANGSDIAKDMANVVLSDDDLSTLVDAIAQGRTIHANIRKALRFLLATNLSEIFVTLGEALHGPNELETPLELLWINLVTDVLPALGLAMLPPDDGIMKRPPRPANAALLSGSDFRAIGIDGAIIGTSTLAAHLYALGRYGPGPQTRAVTFSSIVLSQLAYAYTCRRDDGSSAHTPALFGSSSLNLSILAALGLHALPVFVPGVQRLLGISALRPSDVPAVALSALLPFAIREITHLTRN
jgi:Ca2+-transporting ATPase